MRYRAILGLILALGLVFALLTVRQTASQELAIDELTYAHAGWAMAQGELPYRDFFFHHTPLLLQALAAAFLALGDDPTSILWLRFGMLLPLAAILWSLSRLAWHKDCHTGRLEALTVPALLLMVWPFVESAVEIRPDNLAFALFLLALVIVSRQNRASGTRGPRGAILTGTSAGLLVGAAVWASEKALAYGSVFALGFLVDTVRMARTAKETRGSQSYLLGHPLAFLGGFALAVATAISYLTATGSLDDFQQWGVEWSLLHEQHYPGFSWRWTFGRFGNDYWWWFPLALVGLATGVRDLGRSTTHWSDPDLLLIPALATTLLSFTAQTAPMDYSLVPFLGVCALFVSRGLVHLLRLLDTGVVVGSGDGAFEAEAPGHRAGKLILAALGGLLVVTCGLAIRRLEALPRNDHQVEMLATVAELTTSEDPIYDATGSAVTRPHVSFFFFNDGAARVLLAERLSREIPHAIVRSGCTVAIQGPRFIFQPRPLYDFFFRHFQPYDAYGRIWIWGRAFVKGGRERLDDTFLAVRDGSYFIEPPEAVEGGHLHIGGRPVVAPIVELARGEREIVYTGDLPVFRISWLPRNLQTFRPDPLSTKLNWPIRYRGLPSLPRSLRRPDAPSEPSPQRRDGQS